MLNFEFSSSVTFRVSDDTLEVVARVEIPFTETNTQDDNLCEKKLATDVSSNNNGISVGSEGFILSELKKQGFQGEIDVDALKRLSQASEVMECIVLRGVAPVMVQPAYYKLLDFPRVADPLHSRMRINTVSAGTCLAVLVMEIPGVPGIDVYGRPIQASKPYQLPVLGDGVTEVEGKVYAVKSGRLIFSKARIDVIPELVIDHNVSPRLGKIEFHGDLIVHGTVQDGSFIRVNGRIEIDGSVFGSTVLAEKGVRIRGNVVKSIIIAGQSKVIYGDIYSKIKDLFLTFSKFKDEYLLAWSYSLGNSKFKLNKATFADILMKNRHAGLERQMKEICMYSEELKGLDSIYTQIVHILQTKWLSIYRTNIDKEDVFQLLLLLSMHLESIEKMMSAERANVWAKSIVSSTVRLSGDLFVEGSGVYSSTIYAGKSVQVSGRVRGGCLVANQSARISELGSPLESGTVVEVETDEGFVYVKIRHPNTQIEVGRMKHKNSDVEYEVKISEGKLTHR